MLHRDKYSIEVTDDDIDNAMIQERYNPLQLAIARVTNKCPDEIDIRGAGVFISVYEYADFLIWSLNSIACILNKSSYIGISVKDTAGE